MLKASNLPPFPSAVHKKSPIKQSGEKRPSPGIIRKARKVVSAVVISVATGAVMGAMKGEAEAGRKATGIDQRDEKEKASQKGKDKNSA